jgi:hypothetical protein
MDMTFAVGADPITGAPVIENRRVSLATDTPELRLELGYAREDGPFRLSVSAMSRFNADGEAGCTRGAVMLTTSTRF